MAKHWIFLFIFYFFICLLRPYVQAKSINWRKPIELGNVVVAIFKNWHTLHHVKIFLVAIA